MRSMKRQQKKVQSKRPTTSTQKGRSTTLGRFGEQKTSAPSTSSTITRGLGSTSFGGAPPHEDYPSGGLRLSFSARGPPVGRRSSGIIADGGFLNNAGTNAMCISSLSLDQSSLGQIDTSYTESLFNVWVRTSLAKNFQRYRVRALDVEYIPSCATSTAGRLSLGFWRDMASALQATVSALGDQWPNTNTLDCLDITVSTPVWQGVKLVCIPMQKAGRDDDLKFVTGINSSYGTADSQFAYRQQTQGGIAAQLTEAGNGSTQTNYGSIIYHATIDLYGLDTSSSFLPTLAKPVIPLKERKAETKEEFKNFDGSRGEKQEAQIDVESGAILVKSQAQPAFRTEGRQVGLQDDRRSWFGKS